ncbi:DUF1573 domain-containing protein [Wenyingzhuangia sp. 2_MG-2023]|uniref:DUF1573 domain-containing protein n=1 Tax=Wenyingzhuangia sp. 2_MG-2023 TaxID=3062639 RepID=UPI0026E1BB0E|nr:DUF1573 domain-containing protein [Wenyingzhuangia sp. 2_MG-2023]MDO6739372.1 DUF1573 domain-containing protein [Wenyingzhuangia sp. 2_MG-2023]MDO6802382.1 DUF1573 domain-containing protein [Wenyingzhuangia sp. 1_MG-2023]
MNKLLFFLLCLLVISCGKYAREKAMDSLEKTSMVIEDTLRHYYPIVRGSKLNTTFKFFNTGTKPLVIKEVITSCGCIVADFPESIILPESFGFINVEYDSKKNIGFVEGYIDIYANLDSVMKQTVVFDVNVVTHADYTRDYEEMYNLYLEEEKANALEKGVEGNTNQQGYFTELGGEMKY